MTTQTPQLSLKADFEGNLNVRCSPGTDPEHTIIGAIVEGSDDLFDILGKNAAAATWYQIRYPDTTSGWVSQEFVQTSDDLSDLPVTWPAPKLNRGPTVKGLNVYAGPGTSHDRLAFIKDPKGATSPTQYIILGIDAAAAWYRICVRNLVTGWVRAAYVQTHGDLHHLPIDRTLPQLSLAANAPPEVNVHATPDASQALGIFIRDSDEDDTPERYLILGKDADTAAWYQIRVNNTVTGWVRAAYVQTHGELDNLPVAWQPPLPADSLELPVRDQHGNPIPISSLFNDPRRWWRPQVGVPLRHEGIDWACPTGRPVRAMAGGTVLVAEEDANHLLGKHVTVQSELADGRTFRLTYVHLSDVTVKVTDKNGKPVRVDQGAQLGASGNTGRYTTGAHLHVHYDPEGDVNWLDFFESGNYQDFHAALPQGIYHWPDITDLQADIDAAPEAARNRVIYMIDQWMNSALEGTFNPRLWVKRGGAVYMTPRVDKRFKYPCRPFPVSTVVGKGQAVWNLPHSPLLEDASPTLDWWKIQTNDSFPDCWVHRDDAVVIGNLRDVPLAPSTLPGDLPLYLQSNRVINVRSTPNTKSFNDKGKPVDVNNVDYTSRIADWVPIVELACDATTGDYFWYQIPYDTEDASKRGWVRGDVVTVKGILSEEEKETIPAAFAGIKPKLPSSAPIPRLETKKEVVALVHEYPDYMATEVATFKGHTDAVGFSSLSSTWYQVQFNDESRGWLPASQAALDHASILKAIKPRLRRWSGGKNAVPVRFGPASNDRVVATIAADSTDWHSLLARDLAYPGWWQIRFSNTVSGWVRADDAVETEGNLDFAPPPQVGLANPAQACVVRSQPTATATVAGTIEAGSTGLHPVLERDANPASWYRIQYSNTVTGWVSAACVRLHGDGRNLPVAAQRPRVSLKATVTDGLKVRSGPGMEHAWIGSIPGGSTVRYELLGKDADFPTWYWIRFSDTGTGWVHKDHLLTHGSLEDLEVTWIPQLRPKAATDTIETGGLNVHAGPGAHHRVLVTLPVDATRY
ncbi:MAG: SH3 domain-containing protein, partial [Caldilineaceae bacterium]|nr:SH3 domain-containing protein [Caldilineaceae bacterium]